MVTAPLDLAYVAGIVDGEGTIGTHSCQRRAGSPNWAIRLVVAMTNEEVIRRLSEQFGGSLHKEVQRPDRKPHWRWQNYGPQAENMLRLIEPYLIVKRRQARLALVFRQTRMCMGALTPAQRAHNESVRRVRKALRDEISAINQQRGGR